MGFVYRAKFPNLAMLRSRELNTHRWPALGGNSMLDGIYRCAVDLASGRFA
ncbi:hypothetical protein [Mesorhizobium sp. M0676]|uniref:hypothetical protein n=1 Tax=Mesorhizobium sp. M0676 TaxID=2956984 RepID=UPI003337DB2C